VAVTPSGTGNINATVTDNGGSVGTDSTFTLSITDGTRPASDLENVTLKRRHVTPDPADIVYSAGAGSKTISVQDDAVTSWDWGAGSFSNVDSSMSFPSYTGNTNDITWPAAGLDMSGDDGSLNFSLQPNDDSTPACTIHLGVKVH